MLKNLKPIFLIWILCNPLGGEEVLPPSLSAENLSFQNRDLTLSQGVTLNHPLLFLKSDTAKFFNYRKSHALPFLEALLSGSVFLKFQNNATLACDEALLNSETLSGSCQAKETPLRYQELIQGLPLDMQAETASFELQLKAPGSSYEIRKLWLEQGVLLHYGEDFSLSADKLSFSRGLPDTLLAETLAPESRCTLSYKDCYLYAPSLQLEIPSLNIFVENPYGTLDSLDASCSFSAHKLHWNQLQHTLLLQEEAHLEDPTLGHFATQHSLQLEQDPTTHKLKRLTTEGPTTLNYLSLGDFCYFSTDGSLSFDEEKLQIHSISHPEKQDCYTQGPFTIYADSTLLKYQKKEGRLQPLEMLFEGHVKILSQGSLPYEGYSEKLTLDIPSKKALLSSSAPLKVLFYQKEHHLTLHADALLLYEEPLSKELQFEGLGHVRFVFEAP